MATFSIDSCIKKSQSVCFDRNFIILFSGNFNFSIENMKNIAKGNPIHGFISIENKEIKIASFLRFCARSIPNKNSPRKKKGEKEANVPSWNFMTRDSKNAAPKNHLYFELYLFK